MSRLSSYLAFSVLLSSTLAFGQSVVLVDKASNKLKVAKYSNGTYEVQKTYHTTVGKVEGDKQEEGDLKTPEGIYFFTAKFRPPMIKPKFGSLALYMNYPNSYDRIAGRTGYDIMLHATDEPERLKKDFDSKGCIVVQNAEIEEINQSVDLRLTPILVFEKLTDNYLRPGSDSRLKNFFNDWIHNWTKKNIDRYIDAYHSEFTADGKSKSGWKAYKSALNQRYASIEIKPENVRYFSHPKYSVVVFDQDYRSRYKNGNTAYYSKGSKILYVAEEEGKLKIVDEKFTRSLAAPESSTLNPS